MNLIILPDQCKQSFALQTILSKHGFSHADPWINLNLISSMTNTICFPQKESQDLRGKESFVTFTELLVWE